MPGLGEVHNERVVFKYARKSHHAPGAMISSTCPGAAVPLAAPRAYCVLHTNDGQLVIKHVRAYAYYVLPVCESAAVPTDVSYGTGTGMRTR
jgi:hypothetical protein